MSRVYREVAETFDAAVIGYLGEALSGAHLSLRAESDAAHTARHVAPRLFSHAQEMTLLSEAATARLIERLDGRWRELDDLKPHQRSMLVDLEWRQATFISMVFDVAAMHLDVALPLFNRELIRFFFNLPPDRLRGQRLYRAWRAQARPASSRDRLGDRARRFLLEAVKTNPVAKALMQRASRAGVLPPETFDYHRALRSSMRWLEAQVAALAPTERLRLVCERSLCDARRGGGGRLPTVLSALPIAMASRG